MKEFAKDIASFKLIPADGGRFEFAVNGDLLYSKKAAKRHAEPGEIRGLFKKHLESMR